MALFRVKVRFEQEVELDVQASSPRAAEGVALERVRDNQVASKDLASSQRTFLEVVEGATRVVGS